MAARGILSQLVDLARAVTTAATSSSPRRPSPAGRPASPPPGQRTAPARPAPRDGGPDAVVPRYAPERDGEPDPGEVVWAWVPFEEDPTRGKDRPVLVLSVDPARSGREVVALMLTSKDHAGPTARDAADELRRGRRWLDVGTGAWDAQRRPSEVRLDRVLRLPAGSVRREGAALDERVFARVVDEASTLHGWH